MTGVRDVAAAAGVSVATVSRVLNDSPAVRPETRARVVRAMRELQYVSRERLDVSAGVLVVVVRSLLDPLELELADAIVRHAASHDLSVVVCPSAAVPVAADPGVSGLIERGVAALVLLWCSEGDDGAWVEEEGLPTVVVGGPPLPGAAHVGLGEAEGMRLAVDELRDAGHETILAVAPAGPGAGILLAGARSLDLEVLRTPALAAGAMPAIRLRLADRGGRPTGVVATTGALGEATVAAARELGLDVPADLSVVVLGGGAGRLVGSPPLTSVAYAVAEAARLAVDAAASLFGDPAAPPTAVELRPTLRRGGSTAPPRSRRRA
jgi:LacI family transcriptional regulator